MPFRWKRQEENFSCKIPKGSVRTEGKLKEALLMLAQWEKGHEEFLRGYHDRLFEQYVHMPWGG